LNPVRWGLLSTASIGQVMAEAARPVHGGPVRRGGQPGRRTGTPLRRDGRAEQLPVDPDGTYALAHDDYDVYRLELDAVSQAIRTGAELPFGRADAIDQAGPLQALIRSAQITAPVS
jgi:hypothetical protein